MSDSAIGIFDSGLGGLTAVKELVKVLPNENIVYFGDTARVPYGNRSKKTIIKYAEQDASFLLSKGVKMIIAACGTVSSVATGLRDTLPVPFTGVVDPTADAAVRATRNGKIGVIGPKRMDYAKVIANLDLISSHIDKILYQLYIGESGG